jgi:hypothetical protein
MVLTGDCETEHERQIPDSSRSFSSWERVLSHQSSHLWLNNCWQLSAADSTGQCNTLVKRQIYPEDWGGYPVKLEVGERF